MSIANKITYLNETKIAIAEAIEAKGVTIGETDTFRDYADRIGEISGEGGGTVPPPVSSGFTGTVDSVGLAEIGWDESDISWLQENVWWDEEDNDSWTVPQYDKDIWQDYCDGTLTFPTSFTFSWSFSTYMPNITFFPKISIEPVQTGGRFANCKYLVATPLLSAFTMGKFYAMFQNCSSLVAVRNVTKCETSGNSTSMFYNCYSLQTVPLFDTSGVIEINMMFYGCYSLQTVPLFDFSSVTNATYLFYNCCSLRTVPLFDLSNITATTYLFGNVSCLQSVPEIDFGAVTDTNRMYNNDDCLRNCYIENIGVTITLDDSPLLTVDSMVYMMTHAKTVESATMTFGSTNLAKLTDEQKSIATNKGWTLA